MFIITFLWYNFYYIERGPFTELGGEKGFDRTPRKNKPAYSNLENLIVALKEKLANHKTNNFYPSGIYIVSKLIKGRYIPVKVSIATDIYDASKWEPLKKYDAPYKWERYDSKHPSFMLVDGDGELADPLSQEDTCELLPNFYDVCCNLQIPQYLTEQILKQVESTMPLHNLMKSMDNIQSLKEAADGKE